MIDLKGWVAAGMSQRGKNATGGTLASVATAAISGPNFTQGVLIAEENWKFVGNGRTPGLMPPIEPIQRWINARGLSISAWAVAVGIAKRGSRDFRQHNSNVFTDATEAWERLSLPAMEEKTALLLEDQVVEITTNTLKN